MVGVTLAGVRVLGRVHEETKGIPTWDVVYACGHEGRIMGPALRAAANQQPPARLRCPDCRAQAAAPVKSWPDRVLGIFGEARIQYTASCVGCRESFPTVQGLTAHRYHCAPARQLGTRDQQRSRRKRDVRARTISVKRMTKRELAVGRLLYPDEQIARPKTRVDCDRVPRPCPFVACRYHLYLDVSPRTGSIKLNFPDLEPDELRESCVLDVAEAGGESLEHVGQLANLTRERVRQLEQRALVRLRVFPLHEHDDEPRRPCRSHHNQESR